MKGSMSIPGLLTKHALRILEIREKVQNLDVNHELGFDFFDTESNVLLKENIPKEYYNISIQYYHDLPWSITCCGKNRVVVASISSWEEKPRLSKLTILKSNSSGKTREKEEFQFRTDTHGKVIDKYILIRYMRDSKIREQLKFDKTSDNKQLEMYAYDNGDGNGIESVFAQDQQDKWEMVSFRQNGEELYAVKSNFKEAEELGRAMAMEKKLQNEKTFLN